MHKRETNEEKNEGGFLRRRRRFIHLVERIVVVGKEEGNKNIDEQDFDVVPYLPLRSKSPGEDVQPQLTSGEESKEYFDKEEALIDFS